MKLRQRPHKSPVGVKFKFSNEHSLPFHMGATPPPRVSKCLTGSEGVNLSFEKNISFPKFPKITQKLTQNRHIVVDEISIELLET